jgi:hypothetical protein
VHGDAPDRSLTSLAQELLSEEPLADALDRMSGLAVDAVRTCDHAGIMLNVGGEAGARGASDALALRLDEVQAGSRAGPCIACLSTGRRQWFDEAAPDGRWPEFAQAAEVEGVRRCLALPLAALPEDVPVAALNLYARSKDAFDVETTRCAGLFAEAASFVIASAAARASNLEQAARLLDALEQVPDLVHQATGVLMQRHGWDVQHARRDLETEAGRRDTSVEEVARSVLAALPA